MQSQYRENTFNATGSTQQMAGHGFGGTDHQVVRVRSESRLDGMRFVDVAQRG